MKSESTSLGFEFRVRKNNDVEILHFGHRATTLRGMKAQEFLEKVADFRTDEIQQEMARLTGNFKRGNERTAANHPRNR
jgi:hypothetical protein